MNHLFNSFSNNKLHKYIELVNIHSLNDTISNYFHFMYGFIFPLILFDISFSKNKHVTYIIDNTLEPHIKLLLSLNINIKFKKYIENYKHLNINKIMLKPMDIGQQPKYNNNYLLIKQEKADIMTLYKKEQICSWFNDKIKNMIFCANENSKSIDVIFIKRSVDNSYSSINWNNKKEFERNKKHGGQRRNIINHDKLFIKIKKYFKGLNVISIPFEALHIFYQFKLLNNCKILIAQHGAALGNIAFMKKNSIVVEIIQQKFIDNYENWFLYYGNEFKLEHHQFIVNEENDLFNVNEHKFIQFLKNNNIK
jgi:hypothetical protein